MKKLMILTLVVAIAGAASADVDPALSGSFSTYFGVSLPETKDASSSDFMKTDVSDSMKLNLNATIDEWNTLSVTVGLADAMYWDDINDNDKINTSNILHNIPYSSTDDAGNPVTVVGGNTGTALEVAGDELDNRDNYLRMDAFTLTTDILGALGVDGPVGLSMKFGKYGFGGTASYVNVAPISTKKADGTGGTDDGELGIGFDFKFVDMVTVSTVLYPKNLANIGYNKNTRFEGGAVVKAEKIADMLDIAAYFLASAYDQRIKENPDKDVKDEDGMSMGLSFALAFADVHKVGAGFQYDMDSELSENQAKAQLDYALTLDKVTVGLSYGVGGFNDFAKNSEVKLSVLFNILDNFGLFGGIGLGGFDDLSSESVKYDAGLTTALGSLAIQLGVSNNLQYKAPEDDWNDVVYLKFSTSF